MNNYIIEHGNYKTADYEDGIMDFSLFSSISPKILWVLKETHGKFNPKKWWGDQEYLQWPISPFDRKPNPVSEKKIKKNSKKATWEPVARSVYQILNGKSTDDVLELANALKYIAIINMKKTPGKESVEQEFYEYVNIPENRAILFEQIRTIDPDVIICGNTLNMIHKNVIDYRIGKRILLSEFSSDKKTMGRNSCFCFKDKIFINPFHPSYVMKKDEYVKIIVGAYKNWLEIRDDCPVFKWKNIDEC